MKHLFKWDKEKAKSNLKKHFLSFDDAINVFNDPNIVTVMDRYMDGEYRWHAIGSLDNNTVILVVHTYLDTANDIEIIRIISARKASKKERSLYDRNRIHGRF